MSEPSPTPLRFRPRQAIRYPDDVETLRRLLRSRGYDASPVDTQAAWEEVSAAMCAGWLVVDPADPLIWDLLMEHLQPAY